MKPNPSRFYYYDDRREVLFLTIVAVFWVLTGLFLILRDPLWRLFYEGQITSASSSRTSGWMELDEELIFQLTHVNVSPRSGLDGLESEFTAALNQRAAQEATLQGVTVAPQLTFDGQLRDIARARAEARARSHLSGQVTAPELLYPEIYMAMVRSDRLLRVVEASQPLVTTPAAGSTIPAELVGGWMNNLSFANFIQNPASVEVGVGVTPNPQGAGASVDVLLVQSFIQLDASLPAIARKETPLQLSGRKLSADEVSLYFKGPKDPSFLPLNVQWNGDHFNIPIQWSQGPGTYALRARRADRLSDPRPILVK